MSTWRIYFIHYNLRLIAIITKSIPVFSRSLRLFILNFNSLFKHAIKINNKLPLKLPQFNSQYLFRFINLNLQLLQLVLQIMNVSLGVSRWAIIQLFNFNIRVQVSIVHCAHSLPGFFKHFLLNKLLMREFRLLINSGCHLSFL